MPRLSAAARDEILTETRRRLLEAAATEFAQKGFANANINHISTAAGFARGTIYNYFPSKRALMLDLIDEIAASHTNFIKMQVVAEDDPIQRLRCFFSAGFAFVDQHPAQAQIAISIVYGHDDEFKERIYQAYGGLFALIIDRIVGEGIERGDFRSTDPDTTAALMMSFYLGSCSQIDPTGKIWFDTEQVLGFVMDGLRKRDDYGEGEE